MDWFHQVFVWAEGLVNSNWAYLILFVWTMLEGETILIIAGVAAQDNQPNLALCILAAFSGSLAGDQLWFYVGRLKGKALLLRSPAWKLRAEKVFRALERWNTLLILGFRFAYGLRSVTPLALGMTELNGRRFLRLNVIGAAIWAIAFGVGGYVFGVSMQHFIKAHKMQMVEVLVMMALVYWLTRSLLTRREVRKLRQRARQNNAACG